MTQKQGQNGIARYEGWNDSLHTDRGLLPRHR